MWIWDQIVDSWFFYRVQVLGGCFCAVALVIGLVGYHKHTCCKPPPPEQCMLMDASGSTRDARPRYADLAESIVEQQSEADADVCLIVVKGDPAAESEVQKWYVGADHPDNSSDAPLERTANQLAAKQEIVAQLKNPPAHVKGSALVEALSLVSNSVKPGDTVHVFSDGLQDSANFILRKLRSTGFSDDAIAAALQQLQSKGYVRSLAGVKVIFHKPGFEGIGGRTSVVPEPAIEKFWRAWGHKAGAASVSFVN